MDNLKIENFEKIPLKNQIKPSFGDILFPFLFQLGNCDKFLPGCNNSKVVPKILRLHCVHHARDSFSEPLIGDMADRELDEAIRMHGLFGASWGGFG